MRETSKNSVLLLRGDVSQEIANTSDFQEMVRTRQSMRGHWRSGAGTVASMMDASSLEVHCDARQGERRGLFGVGGEE